MPRSRALGYHFKNQDQEVTSLEYRGSSVPMMLVVNRFYRIDARFTFLFLDVTRSHFKNSESESGHNLSVTLVEVTSTYQLAT